MQNERKAKKQGQQQLHDIFEFGKKKIIFAIEGHKQTNRLV